MHDVSAALARILELEDRFNRELPAVRLEGPLPASQMRAAAEWSDAVWREALERGPAVLSPDARMHAAAVAKRPVFICGAHRSGTTLVRDLLDDHPQLAVLPAEGSYFTNFERQFRHLDDEARRERLGLAWLARLANPINQPPYWLLGRSAPDRSTYVEFARVFLSLWDVLQPHFTWSSPSWPTAAVVLAFAAVTRPDGIAGRISRWVEKTPTNERYLTRIWREFPAALAIHVVRHPLAVVASRKLLEERAHGSFGNLAPALRDLRRSYRIARRRPRADRGQYLVLRYEDVTLDPERTADRLAAFLRIERTEGLRRPTVAGAPSPANTSFDPPSVRGQIAPSPDRSESPLTPRERETTLAVTGGPASALGYEVPALGRCRRVWLQAAAVTQYLARTR